MSRIHFRALVGALLAGVVAVGGLAYGGASDQPYVKVQARALGDIDTPLTPEKERALKPGDAIKECPACPEMVVVPAGAFMMGSNDSKDEQPIRRVTFETAFAVSRFEVTFDEWDACVARRACTYRSGDDSWGRGRQPVINISWDDAKAYAGWLASRTGKPYRLLTETEWEYAARAKSTTRYAFGDDVAELGHHAWFERNSETSAHQVGEKQPNAFRLFDMHGNVWEWVEDCYRPGYDGAPTDGSAVTGGPCRTRVLRGGSWVDGPGALRSAYRSWSYAASRSYLIGIRVGRTLGP